MADAQAFKDHIGNSWLVFGKDFSGIYLIILDVKTGTASKNSAKWTMDQTTNSHWDLARNIPSDEMMEASP